MARVHPAVEWAKTELARGEYPWPVRIGAFRRRQRCLFGFIGEREFRFFVQHKWTDEAVGAACTWHIDPDRQYA